MCVNIGIFTTSPIPSCVSKSVSRWEQGTGDIPPSITSLSWDASSAGRQRDLLRYTKGEYL